MIVASHNAMHGCFLKELLIEYRHLHQTHGLAVFCIQENITSENQAISKEISIQLGESFHERSDPAARGLGLVYDTKQIQCIDVQYRALPQLERLRFWERFYIVGGKPSAKFVQLVTMQPHQGPPFLLANFHLNAAGSNLARLQQIQVVATEISDLGFAKRFVAAGDTNIFALGKKRQHRKLNQVLSPLLRYGAVDDFTKPTHFFARQREPRFSHRLATFLGKLEIDMPLHYDIICTNLSVLQRSQHPTKYSDHDLVWAELVPG